MIPCFADAEGTVNAFAFESIIKPGFVLRHVGDTLKLHEKETLISTVTIGKDSCFHPRAGVTAGGLL